MHIGQGKPHYEWAEHWVRIPDTPTGQANGRTHGVAVSESGNVMVFHQANPAVLAFSSDPTAGCSTPGATASWAPTA